MRQRLDDAAYIAGIVVSYSRTGREAGVGPRLQPPRRDAGASARYRARRGGVILPGGRARTACTGAHRPKSTDHQSRRQDAEGQGHLPGRAGPQLARRDPVRAPLAGGAGDLRRAIPVPGGPRRARARRLPAAGRRGDGR